MKKALLKDAFFEIKINFKRFVLILLIVLLGVGFFAGIKATSPDMQKTIDKFFDDKNAMDIQLISTLGLTKNDIHALKELEEIKEIYGSYSKDTIINVDDKEYVAKIHSISEHMNQIILIEGNLPKNDNECLIEGKFIHGTNIKIGDEIELILDTKKDEEPFFKETTLKIVGVIESPLYISQGRGSTKLLSGRINCYIYVPETLINSEIYTEIYLTLENAKELSSFSDAYKTIVQGAKDKLEELSKTRKEIRYSEVMLEAHEKLTDAQNKLDEEKEKYKKEINDAERKIKDAKKEILDGEEKITSGTETANQEFNNGTQKLQEEENNLKNNELLFYNAKPMAIAQIEQARITLYNLEQQLAGVIADLEQLDLQKLSLQNTKTEIENRIQDLTYDLSLATDPPEIAQIEEAIDIENSNLSSVILALEQVEQNIIALTQGKSDLEYNIYLISYGISSSLAELDENEQLLVWGRAELETQKKLFETKKQETYSQLEDAKKELQNGKNKLRENEIKLEDSKIEAEEKFAEAQEEIDDANKKINDIKKPDWYILDREMNEGYASFSKDTERIANIGKVFPLVFFVIAAFISLNSVTRIVEEQRIQIGTLKALGYTKIQIATKYIVYSLLATLIGGITGMLIGFDFLPKTIFSMYAMMYTLPALLAEFNVYYALTSMLFALICTLGATVFSCISELSNTPASLMRPKPPKIGKRVLLERITFIWSRLDFIKKVTLRNTFRYKKKFLMTIIGVAGCTSLIVAGFGLKDSIAYMVPSQYGEIFKYDIQISFKDHIDVSEFKNISEKHNLSGLLTNTQSAEITGTIQDIMLIVPEDIHAINTFIDLKDRKKDTTFYLNDTSIIITEKIAKLLDVKVGDNIEIKNSDEKIATAVIGAITENYLFHYMYMSPILYEKLFDEEIEYNVIYGITNNLDSDEKELLAKNLLLDDNIASVTLTSYSEDFFQDVLNGLNFIVWVLIICAGLLAFVVLYNLANLNISERIREIATIKVLGFYDNEVYQYVSRESIMLTFIGIAIGLFAGYFLNIFIITTCELDNLMFTRIIHVNSFIYSILITLLFSLMISGITHFSLKKVDMIESLKSVE